MKRFLKKGLFLTLSIGLALASLTGCFGKTPQHLRNNEVNGIQLRAEVSNDERVPIIRTLTLEEYQAKNETEQEKLKDFLSGNMEGDLPCVHLVYDNTLRFQLFKDGTAITTQEPIKVEIVPHLTYEDKEAGNNNPILITKTLTADENKVYTLPIKQYRTQYETYFVDMYSYRLYYSIDGVDYISLLESGVSNIPDDKSPFDSEPLPKPIPPETE